MNKAEQEIMKFLEKVIAELELWKTYLVRLD